MPALIRRPWLGFFLLLGLLTLAGLAYWPGLHGGFLFDDFVNLNAIGATGPVDNWPTFWRYVTSGTADPTGRPLALLSFLIDARDWPADPAPFLRSNLILHLINGALLFVLLRALGRWLNPEDRRIDAAACLGAGLWLLHPLLVSTTLYVVQREAMLPATFTLLGLLAYVHGRVRYARASRSVGAAWMIAGIGFGTGLASLCKGNGALLPLLAGVLEITVLRSSPALGGANRSAPAHPDGVTGLHDYFPDRSLRWLQFVLLTIPSAMLLLYLVSFLPALNTTIDGRPWTITQRLLTEPRILVDYLRLLIMPRSVSSGLYNDSYVISTSLLQPWSTLPDLLLILSLPVLAFWHRRRFPAVAAAVLFYFAGQLLESTVIPLELYFEHRNYLPAMLLFWPLARGICAWRIPRWRRIAVATALLCLFALTTHQRAELWGQPEQLAKLWGNQNPGSSRAQATVAMLEINAGNPDAAVRRLAPLWQQHPYDLQIAFNYIDAACASGRGLSADDSLKLANALHHTDTAVQLIHDWLGKAIAIADSEQCPGLRLADTEHWLTAALQNPNIDNPHVRDQDIEPLLAQVAIRKQQPDIALQHFDRALAAFTTPDVAAQQASLLASNGYYQQALAHLDTYERLKGQVRRPGRGMPQLHAKVLEWEGYWPHEMVVLRSKLDVAIAQRNVNADKSP
jgi:tetratricopeptide (TPR) repeat protein